MISSKKYQSSIATKLIEPDAKEFKFKVGLSYLGILFILFFTIPGICQQGEFIRPVEDRYAIDTTHQIAVWSPSEEARDFLWKKSDDSIFVNNRLYAMTPDSRLLYNSRDSLKLVKTRFPFIQIKTTDSIVDEPKRLVRIQYTHHDSLLDLSAGIELRGNSAM
jgi:hypothetical protein